MTESRTTAAPYGAWPSPISAEALVAGVVSLSGLTSDEGRLYWLEGRPEEGGRTVLMSSDGITTRELTPPPFNVRSRVHEYGGGACRVADGKAYFVNFTDQNLYRLTAGAENDDIEQITDSGPEIRFADFTVDAARNQLLCVSRTPP